MWSKRSLQYVRVLWIVLLEKIAINSKNKGWKLVVYLFICISISGPHSESGSLMCKKRWCPQILQTFALTFLALILWKEKKFKTDRKRVVYNHLGPDVTFYILLDTSSTKQTTLSPACTREKVGGGGKSIPKAGMGRIAVGKSFESVIISQTLSEACTFGSVCLSFWLWVLALQNSTT